MRERLYVRTFGAAQENAAPLSHHASLMECLRNTHMVAGTATWTANLVLLFLVHQTSKTKADHLSTQLGGRLWPPLVHGHERTKNVHRGSNRFEHLPTNNSDRFIGCGCFYGVKRPKDSSRWKMYVHFFFGFLHACKFVAIAFAWTCPSQISANIKSVAKDVFIFCESQVSGSRSLDFHSSDIFLDVNPLDASSDSCHLLCESSFGWKKIDDVKICSKDSFGPCWQEGIIVSTVRKARLLDIQPASHVINVQLGKVHVVDN